MPILYFYGNGLVVVGVGSGHNKKKKQIARFLNFLCETFCIPALAWCALGHVFLCDDRIGSVCENEKLLIGKCCKKNTKRPWFGVWRVGKGRASENGVRIVCRTCECNCGADCQVARQLRKENTLLDSLRFNFLGLGSVPRYLPGEFSTSAVTLEIDLVGSSPDVAWSLDDSNSLHWNSLLKILEHEHTRPRSSPELDFGASFWISLRLVVRELSRVTVGSRL